MSCAFTPLARVVTTTGASHWVRGKKNAIGSKVEKQIIALNITDAKVSHLQMGSQHPLKRSEIHGIWLPSGKLT